MKIVSLFYQRTAMQYPLGVLLVLAILAGLAGFSLPSTRLDASADSLTLEHDASIDYFRETVNRYGSGDFLVITYTPAGDVFSEKSLSTLSSLKQELLQLETVASVNSILDLPLLNSPKVSLSELSKAPRTLLSEGADLELARREFIESPIYRNMVLSDDGKTTALLVNLKLDRRYFELVKKRDALRLEHQQGELDAPGLLELEQVSKEFLDYRTQAQERSAREIANIRGIMSRYRQDAGMFLGGVSMITADMIEFIRSDLVVFGSGVLVFIILMLAVIFRQPRWIILPLLSCCLSAVLVLGYLAWVDWRLTVISSNFVALLLIITLSMTIHLVVRYRELVAEQPDASQKTLVWQMVSFMVLPCLYTMLTTMVAFISLVVSDIRPVIDFGWMMTIGLTVAFITVFLLIPCTLLLMERSSPDSGVDITKKLTLGLAAVAEKHGRLVIAVSLVLAVLSIWGISRLKVENRFIDYFDESTEIYQGMELIDEKLGGTTPLDIILDVRPTPRIEQNMQPNPFAIDGEKAGNTVDDAAFSDDEFGGFDAGFSDESSAAGFDRDSFADDGFASDEFADDEFGQDEFGGGFADVPVSKHGSQINSYWFTQAGLNDISRLHEYLDSLSVTGKVSSLAMTYDVAKQMSNGQLNDFELKFLYKMLPEDIRRVLIYPYLSAEDNQTRISVRVRESDASLRRGELLDNIRHFAVDEMGYHPEQIHFTGMLVLYNNMLNSLFRSQILTLGAVFIGIMLMFFVLFRSFYLSVIAIIPNILAASIVMGLMGILSIPLDMMTITIAAIVIGIGVDHSIHYIHRFRREFAQDSNYLAAMHRSHASIGKAMYYTTVTIMAGFSILALSNFTPSLYFGLLTSLAMFAALMGALLLLPRLLVVLKPLGPGAS